MKLPIAQESQLSWQNGAKRS